MNKLNIKYKKIATQQEVEWLDNGNLFLLNIR